jgi:uncharacterized protein YceH (UPF0502 family)
MDELTHEQPLNIPILSSEEQRVLGSLIEKSRTTPEYYPLTVNSLISACNQKTSRNPVVNYNEEIVLDTLESLRKRGLVSTATGGSSRVKKYKHNMGIVFPLVPAELSILCMLLLRGPMTRGEINNQSGRIFEFESLDEVQVYLDKLCAGDQRFVKQLDKRPGQKEARFIHCLGEANYESYEDDSVASSSLHATQNQELRERVNKLEQQLEQLRAEFDELMRQLS